MNHERAIFLPIAFLVAIIVLFFIFRQLKSIFIPLTAISVTLIWVAGIMAYYGITINVVSYLTFNLLIIIGVSNAIHLLMKYHEGLSIGLNKSDSLERVINKIGGALFLTSFTTAVGFCSLAFSNIKITQQFGLIVAFGVILMFILTIIIMPIILNFINPPNATHIRRLIKGEQFRGAHQLNAWNTNNPLPILAVSLVLLIVTLFGLYRMDYNASVLEDLKPGNPLYDDLQYVEQKLGGTLSLEVLIDSRIEVGSLQTGFMQKIQNYKEMILNTANKLDCESMIVTLGKHGSICFDRDKGFVDIPSFATKVIDTMGAGDAVLSLTSLCFAQKAPIEITGFIGNIAGAHAVETMGHSQSIEKIPFIKHIQSLMK